MSLMMGGDPGLSAFPDGDNIFQWTGTITGSEGTVRAARRPALAHALLATVLAPLASCRPLRPPPPRAWPLPPGGWLPAF